MGSLFEIAKLQLIREGKKPSKKLILKYAIKIRKFIDKHTNLFDKISAGGIVYRYGNKFKVY